MKYHHDIIHENQFQNGWPVDFAVRVTRYCNVMISDFYGSSVA